MAMVGMLTIGEAAVEQEKVAWMGEINSSLMMDSFGR
jgi:hypothetical protein